MDTILVVVEQREGKLNRVSWETIAAGQAIAAQIGWTLEAAVVGSGVAAIAGEVAGKKVAKVYDVASAMQTTAITDAIGYRHEGGNLLFTRQMFQGKFVADVSFAGSGPYFVTFQNGSFRGDKVEAGETAAPVETVTIDIPDSVVRNKPQEVF